MRNPAKKLQRGIICINGNRTGTNRLNGDRLAIHSTIEVHVKCHIAKETCIFFNWGSLKILDSPQSVKYYHSEHLRIRTICSRRQA
jgi:hypothetical protein